VLTIRSPQNAWRGRYRDARFAEPGCRSQGHRSYIGSSCRQLPLSWDPMVFEMQSSALVAGHDASNSRREVGRIHGLHTTGRVLEKVWDTALQAKIGVVSMGSRVFRVCNTETSEAFDSSNVHGCATRMAACCRASIAVAFGICSGLHHC
jgi:hypothetical protein